MEQLVDDHLVPKLGRLTKKIDVEGKSAVRSSLGRMDRPDPLVLRLAYWRAVFSNSKPPATRSFGSAGDMGAGEEVRAKRSLA